MKIRTILVLSVALCALAASNAAAASIVLVWTAPGSNGRTGQAAYYDIRYSTTPITLANWNQATQILNPPLPLPGGNRQYFKVQGLAPATTYFFALRTADAAGNWSGLSNVSTHTTCPVFCLNQGNIDGSPDGRTTAADLALMVAYLTNPATTILSSVCLDQGNIDSSSDLVVSATDLAMLVLYLQTGAPMAPCR